MQRCRIPIRSYSQPPGYIQQSLKKTHYHQLQIARRRRAHQEANPDAHIISLGIGDTTEPIPPFIVDAMKKAAEGLGTLEGYSG
jgi:aspartate/methionine/tyrosine aminotransferase